MEITWGILKEKSVGLEQQNGYKISEFFVEVQTFIENDKLNETNFLDVDDWIRRASGKFKNYSLYLYDCFVFSLELKRNPIDKLAKYKDSNYYECIRQIRRIILYLMLNPINDGAFSKEWLYSREVKLREDKKKNNLSRRNVGPIEIDIASEKEAAIEKWEEVLYNWYKYDARIWEIIRYERKLEYLVDSPETEVIKNRYFINEFLEWLPYLAGNKNKQVREQLLVWLSSIMNSSIKLIERYEYGSSGKSYYQEFGHINERYENGEQVDATELSYCLRAAVELERLLHNNNGDHIFNNLIGYLKADGLDYLQYNPLEAKDCNVCSTEEIPNEEINLESYAEWSSRLELYISITPTYKSGETGTDNATFPSFANMTHKKAEQLSYMFSMLKAEYIHSRESVFNISKELNNSKQEEDLASLTERLKLNFVQIYGLFDRISIFLNDYADLGIPKGILNYRTVWLEEGRGWGSLGSVKLTKLMKNNPFLRAMYSLSRDLFLDDSSWQSTLAVNERNLPKLRNQIIHDYVKVVRNQSERLNKLDEIEFIPLDELYEKTKSLLIRSHDVLIYLLLFIHAEESMV